MFDAILNTFTLPTLGFLFLVVGLIGAYAADATNRTALFAQAGTLLLFLSLHRHGSWPGSASPALQLLLGGLLLLLVLATALNRREATVPWLKLVLPLPVAPWLLELPLPWPESWFVLRAAPTQVLLVAAGWLWLLGLVAARRAPRLSVAAAAYLFGVLIFFGLGVTGGTTPPGAVLPAVGALGCAAGLAVLARELRDAWTLMMVAAVGPVLLAGKLSWTAGVPWVFAAAVTLAVAAALLARKPGKA